MLTLPLVGAWESTALDWRNRADITIVIAAAAVAAIIPGIVITGGAFIAVGSVVGVPTVVSVVVFVRRPCAQETPCCWVLLGRLIVISSQDTSSSSSSSSSSSPSRRNWRSSPLVRDLFGGLGVDLRGPLPAGVGFSGGDGEIRGWEGHGQRRVSEMV
jgi:hypothetical protein